MKQRITFNNVVYELRFISSTWILESTVGNRIRRKWDGIIYSRHGGSQYTKWWKFGRLDKLAIHWDSDFDFHADDKLILAYVWYEKLEIDQYKRDFNTYIGGKNNVFCDKHKCPLIVSTSRDNHCSNCRKKREAYSCCRIECKICLCKTCINKMNKDVPNFISERTVQDTTNFNSNQNGNQNLNDAESHDTISDDNHRERENNSHDSIDDDDLSLYSHISNRTRTNSFQYNSEGNNHEEHNFWCDDVDSSNSIDNENNDNDSY